jgi:acetyl esterase/lipase
MRGNRAEISEEAQAFIAEQETWWLENPPPREMLTPDNAERLRAEHKAQNQAACDAVLVETGATATELELGSARTLLVEAKPRHDIAVLYFFGGSFAMGGPDEDVTITAPLAASLGVPVYGPFYPLSPEARFPAALNAGIAVYRSLLESFSPDRIGIVGESAGGNLALTVPLQAMEEELPPPAAVVALSPWADLTMAGHSKEIDADPTMKIEEHWDALARGYAGEASLTDPLISPLFADYTPEFPATLVTSGTRDLLLSDCARLTTVMRRAGVEATIHVWEGMWHVFEHTHDIPEARESIIEIAGFMSRHLGLAS